MAVAVYWSGYLSQQSPLLFFLCLIVRSFTCFNLYSWHFLKTWRCLSPFLLSCSVSFVLSSPWTKIYPLMYAGLIKVGPYVIWYCGSTNSSNRDPIIQSEPHWDNRDFCSKLSRICNVRSCNLCKWCITFWIFGNPIAFICNWGIMDVLPVVVKSNRWTKKSFLIWPSFLNQNVSICFIFLFCFIFQFISLEEWFCTLSDHPKKFMHDPNFYCLSTLFRTENCSPILYDASLCGPFLGRASTEMEFLTRFLIRWLTNVKKELPFSQWNNSQMASFTFTYLNRFKNLSSSMPYYI